MRIATPINDTWILIGSAAVRIVAPWILIGTAALRIVVAGGFLIRTAVKIVTPRCAVFFATVHSLSGVCQ